MTTPEDICPHCTHTWAGHTPDYDNPQAGRCVECGCRWRNPADIPPPPPPMTAYDKLIANIENVIWNELEAQAEQDGPFAPYVDRDNPCIDGHPDMTAVAAAVARIFIDSQDDCTWCHSCTAIQGWAEPLNGDVDE